MTAYAALIRGIMPMNPNMRNERLRAVFESLGFTKVQTVIASGNVLFEAKSTNVKKLEADIEKALNTQLGIKGTTIIRSKDDLAALVKKNPFKKASHSKTTYLVITFFKNGKQIANILDTTSGKTTDFMSKLEKAHGKEITTRTWKTVERLHLKLEAY